MNWGLLLVIALAVSSVWGIAMYDLLHRDDLTQEQNTRWFVALWVGNLVAAVVYLVWRVIRKVKG